MPAIAAIKTIAVLGASGMNHLTTDAAVSDDRTYDPTGFQTPGVARWVDRSGGISVGYPSFTLSVRPPSKVSRIYKVTAKIDLPTLEVTSPATGTGIQPAPTKAYSLQCNLEFLIPERSTLAERKIMFSQVRSFLASHLLASDGTPSTASGSPLQLAVENYDAPF